MNHSAAVRSTVNPCRSLPEVRSLCLIHGEGKAMKCSLVPILLLGVIAFVAPTTAAEDRNPPGLSIAILVDKNDSGARTIKPRGRFQVVFTNQTERPIRLWDDECQFGWETLSFRAKENDGTTSLMHRPAIGASYWKNKRLKTIVIPPGDTFIWDVNPSRWAGAPEPNNEKPVTLTAVFEIKPTEPAKAQGVWTGLITSEPIKALVADENLRTPHDYLMAGFPKQALKLMQADPTWVNKKDRLEETPLHIAGRHGSPDVVRWLLANGAEVNAVAYNRFTPLHLAQDPVIVKLLVEAKADLSAKSVGGTPLEHVAGNYANAAQSPDAAAYCEKMRAITKILLDAGSEYDLRSACCFNDVERVKTLVADKKNLQDGLAMHTAARYGHVEIVKRLLEHGADPEDASNFSASCMAIEHVEVLKLLFDAGANPKIREEMDRRTFRTGGSTPEGTSLLHLAAASGAVESAKLLLAKGLDVNLTDSEGTTPLHEACRKGHAPMVELLLRSKADLKARTKEGFTSRDLAVSQIWEEDDRRNDGLDNARFQAIIRVLERTGELEADIFAAIACNDVQKVAEILQTDGKAGETKNQHGRVALHWAVTLDCKEIVKLLLDKGANPDIRSREKNGGNNEAALHQAASYGRLEIAEMLIKHGANVNATDYSGATPLHNSIYRANVDLARLLLKHGADVNAKNGKGETPLDWTGYCKNPAAIIKLLQDSGAKK